MKEKLIIGICMLLIMCGCSEPPTDGVNYTLEYDKCSIDLKTLQIKHINLNSAYKLKEQEQINLSDKYENLKKSKPNTPILSNKINNSQCLPYIITIKRLEGERNESLFIGQCSNNTLKRNLTKCVNKLKKIEGII